MSRVDNKEKTCCQAWFGQVKKKMLESDAGVDFALGRSTF
jgi:hypothetical protein